MDNLNYLTTVKQNGAKWHIYTTIDNDDPDYIDIWVQKDGFGIMDMVIGLKHEDGWKDIAAAPIIDFINSTEDDPRYN